MTVGLILAGAENDGLLRDLSNASNEALIEINGKPMISYIVDALRETPDIDRIIIVGPKNELEALYPQLEIIPNEGSVLDNLATGLEHLKGQEKVLILTSDIPMITAEAVADFMDRTKQKNADLYYPINSKELSEAKYPGVKRTFVQIKEGTFTGGNIFLVNTQAAIKSLPKVKEFIALRKKPIKLAGILGYSFILRLVTKTLTIRAAERRVSEILGLEAIAVISPFVEIGVDVDKPEDLVLAEAVLQKKVL